MTDDDRPCLHYFKLRGGTALDCEMPRWHGDHDHPDIARHSGGSEETGYVGWASGSQFDGVREEGYHDV